MGLQLTAQQPLTTSDVPPFCGSRFAANSLPGNHDQMVNDRLKDSVVRKDNQARVITISSGNFQKIDPDKPLDKIIEMAAHVTPSPRQLAWQQMEFFAFIHFGLNTFYNREWGEGNGDPRRFNPATLDARQWVMTIRDAGMKMVILTAKHHDGFCLWPTKYTDYNLSASPWKNGQGDLVKEVADACEEYGLKFGIYLSPWDRHESTYGDSIKYNQFFLNQLRELLTGYGEVSEVWFDGACGEGANGKKQVYDWQSYYKLIRDLQPGAVIAVMGPDVRWVGTESGYGRDTEWSVLPGASMNQVDIASASQQNPADGAFIPGDLTAEDLGSVDKLKGAGTLVWYPAETDVSIRPGWFYHSAEDTRVKSPEKLVDIYFNSVGKNSVLLLNIPPDTSGLIHENDVRSLKGMRKMLDDIFAENLLDGARCIRSDTTIEYIMKQAGIFNVAMIAEDITIGQRISKFRLEAWDGKRWNIFSKATTVGSRRLLRFPDMTAERVRIVIEQSRDKYAISSFGLFKAPHHNKKQGVIKFKVMPGTEYSSRYTGGGPDAVVDNIRGSYDFDDNNWQGYEGVDFITTADLGIVQSLKYISAGFLQNQESWIFMPDSVTFEISDDGQIYKLIGTAQNTISERQAGSVIHDFSIELQQASARYIRIRATNRRTCPDWHPGSGSKSWLFVDEIIIR